MNSNNSRTKLKNSRKVNKININIIPIQNVNYGKKQPLNKKGNLKSIKAKNKLQNGFKYLYSNYLNEQELNSLEYELAILIDKRTYFQYYWSLLKKKQLLLFTFLPSNDYNLFTLKFSLFLLSFSLYFTINAFFFSDDTMHKIHENNGSFNFLV